MPAYEPQSVLAEPAALLIKNSSTADSRRDADAAYLLRGETVVLAGTLFTKSGHCDLERIYYYKDIPKMGTLRILRSE